MEENISEGLWPDCVSCPSMESDIWIIMSYLNYFWVGERNNLTSVHGKMNILTKQSVYQQGKDWVKGRG